MENVNGKEALVGKLAHSLQVLTKDELGDKPQYLYCVTLAKDGLRYLVLGAGLEEAAARLFVENEEGLRASIEKRNRNQEKNKAKKQAKAEQDSR